MQSFAVKSTDVVKPITTPNHPTVNFIWIGEPSSTEEKGIEEHDVGAAKTAAESMKNPIIFWCLSEYLEHYKKVFLKTKVVCQAVEPYLKQDFVDAATKEMIEKMYAMLLNADRKKNRRDRTTFKVAFAYFLLHQAGGYTLDTNVSPTLKDLGLPAYDRLMLPLCQNQSLSWADVWTMYAPPGREITKKIFLTFCQACQKAESIYQKEGHSKSYHDAISTAVIGSIDLLDVQNKTIGTWICTYPNPIIEIGLQKDYFRTHTHENRNLHEGKVSLLKDNLNLFFATSYKPTTHVIDTMTTNIMINTMAGIIREFVGDDVIVEDSLVFHCISTANYEGLSNLLSQGKGIDPNQRRYRFENEVTPFHYAILEELNALLNEDFTRVASLAACRRKLKEHGVNGALSALCQISPTTSIQKTADELEELLESGELLDLAELAQFDESDYQEDSPYSRLAP